MFATNIQPETTSLLALTSVGLRISNPLNPAKVEDTYRHSGAEIKCCTLRVLLIFCKYGCYSLNRVLFIYVI